MSHKYLILGLLAEQPMTGYDIRKHVKDVLSAATSTSYGTLYPMLHKMLKDGSLEVQEIPQKGRPAKKVYRITPDGQREFNLWLKRPPEGDKIKREFLLKLYLARHLSDAEVLTLLSKRRAETETAMNELTLNHNGRHGSRTNGKHGSNGTAHNALPERDGWIRDYMVKLYQAEMEWLKQIETELTRLTPVTT